MMSYGTYGIVWNIVLLIMFWMLLMVLIFYLNVFFKFPLKVLEINIMQICF